MALEKTPASKFGGVNELAKYRPPADSVRIYHTITNKSENFTWIANRYNVPVLQLIGLNFPGAVVNGRVVPEIVNWYLNNHEQFRCPETFDKKNRIFKGGEKLAIPSRTINIDEPLVITAPSKRLNIWAGAGYKIGMTAILVGNETGQLACVSLDDVTKGFTATFTSTRLGPGIGASGAPIIVFIASMKDSSELSGFQTGGMGFNLAIGLKVNGMLKSARTAGAVKVLTDYALKLKTMGRASSAAVQAGALLAEYNSQIVSAVDALGMDRDASEPQVLTVEVPVGGFGVELSWVHSVTTFHLEYAKN